MEGLQTPAMFTMPSSCLSAFSSGRSTAMVVDIGHAGTVISPVVDGFEMKHSLVKSPNGGSEIDKLLKKSLQNILPQSNNLHLRSSRSPSDVVQDLKHWMCVLPHFRVDPAFRSCDGLSRLGLVLPPAYELPDGTMVDPTYGTCIIAEDVFFPDPSMNANYFMPLDCSIPNENSSKKRMRGLLNHDIQSPNVALHDLIYYSVSKSDVDTRKELLSNIALVGGGSLIAGLPQRLGKELSEIVPSHLKVGFFLI